MDLGNIDDQIGNPNINNRDHLVGRPTSVAYEVLQPHVFHPTILPFLRLRYIMSYVDLCVICGRGKAQFDVRNQGQEEEDSI